ncbi:hypothetical protein UlMin_002642 [Ulmus minor]
MSNEETKDWKNLGMKLKNHETSNKHIMNMSTWFDLELRLINKEKQHWRNILVRIIVIMKNLAKNNLAFCGDNENIYQENNENFLCLIEMISIFNPIIQEHLIKILALEIKNAILKKIKEAKYFSIMLDCTLDVSHQEQISLVLRCADISTSPVRIEKCFLGFLNVDDTSRICLFSQGYDNGSNIKGKYQGVQKRLLEINPRALYTPCSCHSLNLEICDIATSCVKAISFFGVLERIYLVLSSSPKHWKILKNNISSLTVKPLSQIHWESCIESRCWLELAKTSDDPKIKSEAKCLATYELEDFEFLLGMTSWYDILFAINSIVRFFKVKICILLGDIPKWIQSDPTATKMTGSLSTETRLDVIIDEKQRRSKNKFDENVGRDTILSVEESFRINYFIYMVDQVICSLKSQFEQFEQYEKIFEFLFNLKKLKPLDEDVLRIYSYKEFLKYDELSNIDGLYLFSKLKILRENFQKENNSPIEQRHFINKKNLATNFCDSCFCRKKFFKIKVDKVLFEINYVAKRLNGLVILSINKDLLNKLEYKYLINNFDFQKIDCVFKQI